jgi:hypothetical protein
MNQFAQTKDPALQAVVTSAIEAIAPERAAELMRHWEQYEPEVQITDDGDGADRIVMQAGLYRFIRFNHRTMRLFWLASFMLWEGYESLSRYGQTGQTDVARFKELHRCFLQTLTATNVDAVPWPDGIPAPGDLVDHVPGNPARVAGELAIFAVGWAFLHEVRHLIHQQEQTSADAADVDACRREELSCDLFATEFLLSNLAEYAQNSGQSLELLQMKRQTAIYGALFAIALLSQGAWAETDSHPALQRRIDEAVASMERHGFNIIAAAIGASAFSTLQLQFADAPTPLLIPSVAEAFQNWRPPE